MNNFDIDYAAIGQNIKRARKQKGMTQEQLADITGISKVHISNMENANTNVSLASLVKIARALDASIDRLIGFEQYQNDYTIELGEILNGCEDKKARVMIETMRTMRKEMDNM